MILVCSDQRTAVFLGDLKEEPLLATRFTDLVGCTVPIQQAPIGNLATARLAAAVADAGYSASYGVYGAFQTASEKLARLNRVATAIEYEVAEDGSYRWTACEWTGSAGR